MHYIGEQINTNLIIAKDEEKTSKYNHGSYWIVQCSICGKERSCRDDNLNKKCRSCAAKMRVENDTTSIIDDLTGKEFGYWYVLEKAKKPNYWICKCQNCGTIKEVFRGNLTQGKSKSCGCIKSWGEEQIVYLLKKYHIEYKKEIYFEDLKTDKNYFPRFDFGLYINNNLFCLLEYDGRQHKTFNNNWKMTEEDFKRLQYIDNLKNNYCQDKTILLYRFDENTDLELEISKLYSIINNKEKE